MTIQPIDREGAGCLLVPLLARAPDNALLEIRSIAPVRSVSQRFFRIEDLRRHGFGIGAIDPLDGKAGVYYSVVPRLEHRGTAAACAAATAAWADFDTGAPASLPLPPSIVVQTSPGKFQALWLLAEPCHDLGRIEALNKAIAILHGGDLNSCDRARVLRLPGFLNLKYPTRPRSRLVVCRAEVRYTMKQLAEGFPPRRAPANPPRRGRSHRTFTTPGWLGLVYGAILNHLSERGFAPRPAGQDRTMSLCPLHDDTHPSLSLHATRGWKCFAGCGQGRLTALAARLGVTGRRTP